MKKTLLIVLLLFVAFPAFAQVETPFEEQAACTNTFGTNAYLRDPSTGFCGCAQGYTAEYLGPQQGEQCVDPTNVVLIPPSPQKIDFSKYMIGSTTATTVPQEGFCNEAGDWFNRFLSLF